MDLGDGNGYRASDSCSAVFLVLIVASAVNETAVIRYNYGDPSLGACTETIKVR